MGMALRGDEVKKGVANMAQNNRQAARQSATNNSKSTTDTKSTGGRRPGAETRQEGSDAAEQTEAAAPERISLVVVAPNPKRAGSIAHGFFEKYGKQGQMTDLHTCRYGTNGKDGVRGKDVSWDRDRRHILLAEEADNFPIDGTKEEQAKYLMDLPASPSGFKIDEKTLIKWGYLPEPPKEEAKADEAKQTENA